MVVPTIERDVSAIVQEAIVKHGAKRDALIPILSEINHAFITPICDVLGITTPITWSSEYATRHAPSERLIDLCLAVGATEYLSGPSAANYLDIAAFEAAGVAVQFADYSGYAEYLQLHGPFEHSVSVLDLLFCTGPRALDFMKKL